MNSHVIRILLSLFSVAILANCRAPIYVKEVRPTSGYRATANTLPTLVDEVRAALKGVERGDKAALAAYNERLSRLMEALSKSGDTISGSQLAVNSPGGIERIRIKSPDGFQPPEARLIPVDTLEFSGKFATTDSITPGIGAPVVAVKSVEGIGHTKMRKNRPLMGLTALMRFKGGTASLELIDPFQTETVNIAGRRRTLAADYSSAPMYGLSKGRIDRLGFDRLLNPYKFADTTQLNFLQPYDSDRIPVLMVHGLDSTPATWAPIYFSLLQDSEIRKNYQFWVFSYPSGYPYPYSASLLRAQLEQVHRDFPDHKDIVIYGHSMGSLISRLMVTNVGDSIWISTFGTTPDETNLSGKSRDLLEKSLVFSHDDKISRAVFFSGPHRGSTVATKPIVRLANRLVRIPAFMADVRNAAASAVTADGAAFALKKVPSSVDTLSPNNHFVKEINKHPIVPGVPYHSVIGDRGKGNSPHSSDGVVEYWSSHLKGAESEKVVPSGHGSHAHPVGMEEGKRILKLHLRESN